MPRPSIKKLPLNFDDPAIKLRAKRQIDVIVGWYEWTLTPRRLTRSLAQNAYWWGVIVQSLYEFLRDQDYEISSPNDAHEILKAKLLTVTIRNPRTGAIIGFRVRSTTELDTAEFTDLIDRARAWLLDFFHITTEKPEPYELREDHKNGLRTARQ